MHGIKINEPTSGARPITAIASAVIGMIATSDAPVGAALVALDAAFPVGVPVLLTDVRGAIAKAGPDGTLKAALEAIADQCSPVMVVVRVAEGIDAAALDANVVAGIEALHTAESLLGVRPRIIGAPGLHSADVNAQLATTAATLRGMAYTRPVGDTVAEAVLDRENYSSRELMLIYPDFSDFSGQAVAVALGTRAKIDETEGWHKSLSNVGVSGVTGLSEGISFDILDDSNDAGVLNAADVTTLVRMKGFRFWGNRTCSDEPLFAFETVVRTAQAIKDECAAGLAWAIDKPLTPQTARDIIETINARLRYLTRVGRLIGGEAYFDASLNPKEQLAAGKLTIEFDFTPVAPLEGLTLNQRITDRFYSDLAAQI